MGSNMSSIVYAAQHMQYEDGSIIKSLHSKAVTDLTVHNTTRFAANVYWLDYNGVKTLYALVPPDGKLMLSTFFTHPWTFEAAGMTNKVLVVNDKRVCFPTHRGQVEHIQVAKKAEWTVQRHKEFAQFDPAFQACSQELLRCHHVAWRQAANPSPPAQSKWARKRRWASRKGACCSAAAAADEGPSQVAQAAPGLARSDSLEPLSMGASFSGISPRQLLPATAGAASGASSNPGHKRNSSDGSVGSRSHIGSVPLDTILHIIQLLAPDMADHIPIPLSDLLDITLLVA